MFDKLVSDLERLRFIRGSDWSEAPCEIYVFENAASLVKVGITANSQRRRRELENTPSTMPKKVVDRIKRAQREHHAVQMRT